MTATWLLFWGGATLVFEGVHEKAPVTRSSHINGTEFQTLQSQPQEQSTDLHFLQLPRPTTFSQDIDEREEFVFGPSRWV